MGRGFSAPLEKEGLEKERGGKVGGGREKEIEIQQQLPFIEGLLWAGSFTVSFITIFPRTL